MQSSHIRFAPVRLKARHDGWTSARQRHFIQALAATKSVSKACKAVGMSRVSAYALRDRDDASGFRRAWTDALQPDFAVEPRCSQRMRQSIRLVRKRRKVDNVEEVEGAPNSPASAPSFSSALNTLETYLALLRAQGDPS
jgi:hypothetical protein